MADEEFYDLSRDLISTDENSLKMINLFNIITRLYTPELILHHVNNLYPQITTQDDASFKANQPIWEEIERTVVAEAKTIILLPIESKIVEVTHYIGTQIYIFLSKNNYPINILAIILNNLKFTQQGTINLKDTFSRVIRIQTLHNTIKFEIACRNFMGEEVILKYFKQLPHILIQKYLNENPETDERIPICFFVCRFTKTTKRIERTFFGDPNGDPVVIYFSNINDRSALEYLFYWAMLTFNDMALHYLWKRYISLMGNRDSIINTLITLASGDVRMTNFIIYLLLNISSDEASLFFYARSNVIFSHFLLQLRWQNSFVKVIRRLNTDFEVGTYTIILKNMVTILCSDERHKFSMDVFREFTNIIPDSEKITIFNDHSLFILLLLHNLLINKELEASIILMKIGNPFAIDKLFMKDFGIILFEMIVYLKDFKSIDVLLENTMSSPESIEKFKKFLFDRKAYKICDTFISQKKLEDMKEFINWCLKFISPIDIKSFISSILFYENGKITRNILFHNLENADQNFEYVDKVLQFCYDSEDRINVYKSCLIMVKKRAENVANIPTISLYLEIMDCTVNSKFSFLTQLFKWKNCLDEEIRLIKNSLISDVEYLNVILFGLNLVDYLPNFMKWYDESTSDRTFLIQKILDQDKFFVEKVNLREFRLVRDVIEILNPSEIEVQRFKKNLYRLTEERFSNASPYDIELINFLSWIKIPS
ncbi:UNVERIFIED_CONTAM: hypothetical protein RMT77_018350 [Armadillidium vulgare]